MQYRWRYLFRNSFLRLYYWQLFSKNIGIWGNIAQTRIYSAKFWQRKRRLISVIFFFTIFCWFTQLAVFFICRRVSFQWHSFQVQFMLPFLHKIDVIEYHRQFFFFFLDDRKQKDKEVYYFFASFSGSCNCNQLSFNLTKIPKYEKRRILTNF